MPNNIYDECKHIDTVEDSGTLICSDCGEEIDEYMNFSQPYEDTSYKNISYNLKSSSKSKTHYMSEYSSDKQTSKNRTEIVNLIKEALDAAKEHVPEEEICKTAELFLEIKSVNPVIIKTKNKVGTLGACLLLVCNSIGQYRKLSEIRKIFNIENDKYILSNLQNIYVLRDTEGIQLPENCKSLDVICMETAIRESNDPNLLKYNQFALDILERVNNTLIHALYNFKIETVVNGILNIINNKMFAKKYFTHVISIHYMIFRDIYVKHGVPMPLEWYIKSKNDNTLIMNDENRSRLYDNAKLSDTHEILSDNDYEMLSDEDNE